MTQSIKRVQAKIWTDSEAESEEDKEDGASYQAVRRNRRYQPTLWGDKLESGGRLGTKAIKLAPDGRGTLCTHGRRGTEPQ